MESKVNLLPYLNEDVTKRLPYYSFCRETVLFVNVERDFGRIAPLCEAALAYCHFEDCLFIDIARPRPKGLLNRANLALYDFFRGGYMPQRISKMLSSQGIKVVSNFDDFTDEATQSDFTAEEKKKLLKGLRNENIQISLHSEHFMNQLLSKKIEALRTVNALEKVIRELRVTRTFVWNGRFFNSTLVEIASTRAGAKCSKVEFGAFVDRSFEICRDSSSSLLDQSRRFFAHLGIDDRAEPMTNFENYLISRSSNPYTNNFVHIQTSQLPSVGFFTFYLTSYLETILEDVPGLPTQEECVLASARELESRGLKLLLRLHPNPQAPEYEILETEYWSTFLYNHNISNCEIVGANSRIDSYQLANLSLGSLCYVSTIGLELNARNQPCLYLIKQPWESEFGMPETQDVLIKRLAAFIVNPSVMPIGPASGYMNFLSTFGFKYKYLKKVNVSIYFGEKRFMKERENEHLLLRTPVKIKKFLRFLVLYILKILKNS